MPTTRTQRVRTPVKCHLCKEDLRRKQEKRKSKKNQEHTDMLDYRTIPGMSMAEEDMRSQSYRDQMAPRLSEEDMRSRWDRDQTAPSLSEDHNQMAPTLTEKTVVPPLEEFTPVPNLAISTQTPSDSYRSEIAEMLENLGFTVDSELNAMYASDSRTEMRLKYHGMGHCQVVGVDPRRQQDERCYFIGILGGSNGYDAEDNDRAFRRIGQLGTRYFDVVELITAINASHNSEIYLYDSAPRDHVVTSN